MDTITLFIRYSIVRYSRTLHLSHVRACSFECSYPYLNIRGTSTPCPCTLSSTEWRPTWCRAVRVRWVWQLSTNPASTSRTIGLPPVWGGSPHTDWPQPWKGIKSETYPFDSLVIYEFLTHRFTATKISASGAQKESREIISRIEF